MNFSVLALYCYSVTFNRRLKLQLYGRIEVLLLLLLLLLLLEACFSIYS